MLNRSMASFTEETLSAKPVPADILFQRVGPAVKVANTHGILAFSGNDTGASRYFEILM